MPWSSLFLLLVLFTRVAVGDDPYAGIERHTLDNGLNVVLVSVPTREIELEVKVHSGWREEDATTLGVAHVLEHAIQRDAQRGAAQSYPAHFKEEVAGKFQGSTTWKSTSFSVTVPSLKGIWALNEFNRMLFNRTFTADDVEKARLEVWREIGEPTDPLLHFLSGLYPPQWVRPDFFVTEFGVENTPAIQEQVRRHIRRLTEEDLKAFYKEHYVPNNMTLFYAGPFKEKESLAFMKETFEREPARQYSTREAVVPTPRPEPYVRSSVALQGPWLSIGTKFWNIEPEDEMALQLFVETVVDHFRAEMAGAGNGLSSVDKKIYVDEGRYGYAILNFEFATDAFRLEKDRLSEYITRKAYYGELGENEIQLAKQKIRRRIEEGEFAKDGPLTAAQALLDFQQTYETDTTPLEVLNDLTSREIKERLARLFVPEHAYVVKHEPPLVFRGEAFLLWFLAMLGTVVAFRFGFARNFPHTKVRYVRKVRYTPFFFLLSGFVFLNFFWVVCQVFQYLETRLLGVYFVQNTFLLSHYALMAFFISVSTAIAMLFLGSIPRKILIVDNKLWIKSISFRSRRFPKGMIKTIFCCRPYQLVTMGFYKEWPRLFHWALWKRGLFIELKDGTSYYLGFQDADAVLRELNKMFHEALHDETHTDPIVDELSYNKKAN